MRGQCIRGLLAALTFCCFTAPLHGENGAAIYKNGLKSSVQVHSFEKGEWAGSGSGSVVNLEEGYIITNWHVVNGGDRIGIVFPMWEEDGQPVYEEGKYARDVAKIEHFAKVIVKDEHVDLAIIKLLDPKKIPSGTRAVRFSAESPSAGDKICSIGNPGASEAKWIYTPGRVRSVYVKEFKSSSGDGSLNEHKFRFIEATSLVSQGDSGGPCFNDRGEQVGVAQSVKSAAAAQGYSGFVDASEVKILLKRYKISFNEAKANDSSDVEGIKGKEVDGQTVYANAVKSTAWVILFDSDGRVKGWGSGSLINKDGHILTNHHVVQDCKRVAIIFPLWDKGKVVVDRSRYETKLDKMAHFAKVIASDESCDLGLVKLEQPSRIPSNVVPVRFGASAPIAGSKVHSVGNAGASGARWVYTPGEVRSVYRKEWLAGGEIVKGQDGLPQLVGTLHIKSKIVEATSPISQGDSGGPCFNDDGEQIGVTEGHVPAQRAQGYSFFIEVSEIRAFLKKNKASFVSSGGPTIDPKKLPPKVNPDTKNNSVDPPMVQVKTDAEVEREAAKRLKLLRPLAKDPNKKTFVIETLNKLIADYPKTEAAKEARMLLKQLQ